MGGRIVRTLFFAVFLLVGLATSAFFVADIASIFAERGWTPTPCTIDHSSLVIAGSGYRLEVHYRYSWQGRTFVGTVYHNRDSGSDDASEVQRLVVRYAPGSAANCLVNPANPSQAILAARSLWNLLRLLVPLAFLLPGVLGLWFTWRPIGWDGWQARQAAAAPMLGSVFTLAGLGMFFGLALPGLAHFEAAKSWLATPCIVESSRVAVHTGSKHDTYSADVLYRYQFGGRTYQSNRYYLSGISSSSGDAYRIVHRYPAGTRAVCYVNPADPFVAALDRKLDWAYVFLTPFSLTFALIGMAALLFGRRMSPNPRGISSASGFWPT